MSLQTALHDAARIVGEYGIYLCLVFWIFGLVYAINLRRTAYNDIRNTGGSWLETSRIAHAIVAERYVRRHVPTIIMIYGVPTVFFFLALLPFLSSGKH
jgi:hypothetical protein